MKIKVGILTDGAPQIEYADKGAKISNLLIGENFHWQQTREALFAGEIIALPAAQGNIHVINEVDIEDYVAAVIGSEMNPEAPMEFLKVHAIISRSWAARKILCKPSESRMVGAKNENRKRVTEWEDAESHEGFDVCSDDHCQRYQGIPENESAIKAVKDTEGIVLVDERGDIADARFSKCCGGHTELFSTCWNDSDKHYLVSQEDNWCDLSDMTTAQREEFLSKVLKDYDRDADFDKWRQEIDAAVLGERIKEKYGVETGEILEIKPLRRGPSGRIYELELRGSKGKFVIGKTLVIRRLLAPDCLKSSKFEVMGFYDQDFYEPIEIGRRKFLLEGSGWGHGVGLCQIGAARMTAEGKSCEEILQFYYPGTKLQKL